MIGLSSGVAGRRCPPAAGEDEGAGNGESRPARASRGAARSPARTIPLAALCAGAAFTCAASALSARRAAADSGPALSARAPGGASSRAAGAPGAAASDALELDGIEDDRQLGGERFPGDIP